jgi:hypothetical protein
MFFFHNLPGGTEKDDDESVGIVRVLGKIRTVQLWTTNQNICRLTPPLHRLVSLVHIMLSDIFTEASPGRPQVLPIKRL